MQVGRRKVLQGLVLVVSAASVLALGCTNADPDNISPVPAAGTVNYKGKPVESGTIQFVPAKGRPASGTITNGRFSLSTNDADDGAVPGKHQVGITATKEIPSKNGAEPTVVFLIPENFSQYASSGVEVDVPADGNTNISIDIK